MRSSSPGVASVLLTFFTGFFFVALVLLGSDPSYGQGRDRKVGAVELPPVSRDNSANAPASAGNGCTCPGAVQPPSSRAKPIDDEQKQKLWPRPSLADLKATLDDSDAVATLEAVQVALTEVGDGATYVWHRRHGRLSGAIQPTSSFKDAAGLVCRHLVLALTSGSYSRKAEGIACRKATGVWHLEG